MVRVKWHLHTRNFVVHPVEPAGKILNIPVYERAVATFTCFPTLPDLTQGTADLTGEVSSQHSGRAF
jgi:hypothetical protein